MVMGGRIKPTKYRTAGMAPMTPTGTTTTLPVAARRKLMTIFAPKWLSGNPFHCTAQLISPG
jgi:hypothetical protein